MIRYLVPLLMLIKKKEYESVKCKIENKVVKSSEMRPRSSKLWIFHNTRIDNILRNLVDIETMYYCTYTT